MKALVLREYLQLHYEDVPEPTIGPDDVLKVIDQGSDESVNAVSINTLQRADGVFVREMLVDGVPLLTAHDAEPLC